MKDYNFIDKNTLSSFLEENIQKLYEEIIAGLTSLENTSLIEDIRFLNETFNNHQLSVEEIQNVIQQIEDSQLFLEAYKQLDLNHNDHKIERLSYEEVTQVIIQAFILYQSIYFINIISFLNHLKNRHKFDVFLSHCSWDAREVISIKLILEKEYGMDVYVDWIEDKHVNLPRAIAKIISVINSTTNKKYKIIEEITKKLKTISKINLDKNIEISNLLISRINNSRSVFYVQSRHHTNSLWMPWELGIAEADKKDIYRVPIKYVRIRQKFNKGNGFLVRYQSIIDIFGLFDNHKINLIKSKRI